MRRVLFTVAGVRVWSYPAFLYAGLLCGFYVMYAIAPQFGMRPASASAAALILFAPAIAGARLWFVFDHWDVYRRDLRRTWRYAEGGMTIYGGLVLTLLLSPAVLDLFRLRFTSFWDAATFTMLVGMVFARVGCLLNGCCAGRQTDGPLGRQLPDHAGRWERRHPVALLELSAGMVLLAASVVLLALSVPRGAIFGFGLAGYAGVRLALDRLREPSPRSRVNRRVALSTFLACSLAASALGLLATGS